MAIETPVPPEFTLGARVRIKNYPGPDGQIVELRGPLGPGGIEIYRVAIPQKPGFSLVELRGNQLELVKSQPKKREFSKLMEHLRANGQYLRRPGSLK